jgi:hypothetical protein
LQFTEEQIEGLAANAAAIKAGKKLTSKPGWDFYAKSDRVIWGAIKGSGKNPYTIQVDILNLAYKCSCPSRQFPCKHGLALLFLYAQEKGDFVIKEEPDDINAWLGKRDARLVPKEVSNDELTEDQIEKRATGKVKRQKDREKFINSGIDELILWLRDVVRLGILDLPNKDYRFFENVALRMVDAKASGLAGRVRELSAIDYSLGDQWQNEVIESIGRTYLLLKSYQNSLQKTQKPLQGMLKGLIGQNLSTKELLEDETALHVKDQWLVLGSIKEALEKERLVVAYTWLLGLETNQDAILIAFETPFNTATELTLINGSILEAELVFYPDPVPHRAFITGQVATTQELIKTPKFQLNWVAAHHQKVAWLKLNPWVNNKISLVKNVYFSKLNDQWIVSDQEQNYRPIIENFPNDKLMKALFLGESPFHIAVIEKENSVYPIGVFNQQKYYPL